MRYEWKGCTPEPEPGRAGLGAGLARGSQLDSRCLGVVPPLVSQGEGPSLGPLLLPREGVLLQSSPCLDRLRGVDSQSLLAWELPLLQQ